MLADLEPVVIVTCVDYWDYLAVTLPHTLKFASKVYVITNLTQTGNVVHKKIEYVYTDAFTRNDATFNKSAAVRETQLKVHAAHPDDWILLLDADVIAAPDLCHDVACKDTLYGVSRLDFERPEDLEEDRATCYHSPGAGYFQLYFDKTKVYPESSEDASECDIRFYAQFDNHVICGGAVHHLGVHTVNWKGRVSEPWTPVG